MSHQEQRDFMERWFLAHYEDPMSEMPWDSEVDAFIYPWGGPYDANDVLNETFDGTVDYAVIESLAAELSRDIPEWAPRYPEDVRDWEDIDDDGADEEIDTEDAGRSEVSRLLGELEIALQRLRPAKPAHGEIGHNRPPESDQVSSPLTAQLISSVELTISDLRVQLEQAVPDAAVIEESSKSLEDITHQVGTWMAGKLDVGATEFVKQFSGELGKSAAKWVSPGRVIIFATAVANFHRISELVHVALDKWLMFLK